MSIQIPWAPGAVYTKLLCRLGEPRPDSYATDTIPDLMTQGGSVRLKCDVKRIRYTEADGRPRMLSMNEWAFNIRPSDGELLAVDSNDFGVYILSGLSEGVEPANFGWTATVTPASGDSWTVRIPATSSSVIDLASAAIIPELPSTPVPMIKLGNVSAVSVEPSAPAHVDVVGESLIFNIPKGEKGDIGEMDLKSVRDAVAAMLVQGPGITLTYDDATGKLTVSAAEPPA